MSHRRHGFLLPLALFAAVSFGFFLFTIFQLSRNYRNQVHHTNKRQLCFQIAYSAYSKTLGRIHDQPWSQRFFKNGPQQSNNVDLFGGTYDLYVEDAPGQDHQADIYVRSTFAGLRQLYFWRIEVRDDLLDLSGRIKTSLFTCPPVDAYPTGGASSFGSVVNDLLQKRKNNAPKSEQLAGRLATVKDVRDAASIIGAREPLAHTGGGPTGAADPVAVGSPPNIPVAVPQWPPAASRELEQADRAFPDPAPPNVILAEIPLVETPIVPPAAVAGVPPTSPDPDDEPRFDWQCSHCGETFTDITETVKTNHIIICSGNTGTGGGTSTGVPPSTGSSPPGTTTGYSPPSSVTGGGSGTGGGTSTGVPPSTGSSPPGTTTGSNPPGVTGGSTVTGGGVPGTSPATSEPFTGTGDPAGGGGLGGGMSLNLD